MSKKPKGGRGKRKGSKFERQICKALSLWVSNGEKTDVFWRSAMSGGRATVHARKGTKIRQAGDICAVAPEGNNLCDTWFIECKNVKDLGLASFMTANKGPLAKHWKKACKQAEEHERYPMLIIRSNGPILVFTYKSHLDVHTTPQATIHSQHCAIYLFSDIIKHPYQ